MGKMWETICPKCFRRNNKVYKEKSSRNPFTQCPIIKQILCNLFHTLTTKVYSELSASGCELGIVLAE